MFCFRVNAPIESYLIKYIPRAFWIMPGLNRKKLRQYQMFMLILFFFIHWNLEKKAFLKRFSFSEKKKSFLLVYVPANWIMHSLGMHKLCRLRVCQCTGGTVCENTPSLEWSKRNHIRIVTSDAKFWVFTFLQRCFFFFFLFFLSSILWKGINCNEQEDIVFIFFLQGKWSESYNHRNKVSECFAC